jgi:hypothetical protein
MEMFQSDIYMWAAHRTRETCGSDACTKVVRGSAMYPYY